MWNTVKYMLDIGGNGTKLSDIIRRNGIYLLAVAVFLAWGGVYIMANSYVAPDGTRYYYIFDDALISMRYAWNLAHGHGLLWNPGEPPVQGYTNMLMTLFMTIPNFLFSKPGATLALQLSGFAFQIMTACLTVRIARLVAPADSPTAVKLLPPLSFICTLFYYPLAFWSLLGMETGLLTTCFLAGLYFCLRYEKSRRIKYLYWSTCFLAMAFLTRNESSLYAAWVGGYALLMIMQEPDKKHLRPWAMCTAMYVCCAFALLFFQHGYYGEWLPNTYTLKVEGLPVGMRLYQGFIFIMLYLKGHIFMLTFIFAHMISHANRHSSLLLLCSLAAMLYQLYIGGDAWPFWRIVCPIMPLLFILFILSITSHVDIIARKQAAKGSDPASTWHLLSSNRMAMFALLLAGAAFANARFAGDMMLLDRPYLQHDLKRHVNSALAISELTKESATIGVIAGGAIPYYADLRAGIDFLGKSDKYIARLPPDISGMAISKRIMAASPPGHNKYDLEYSIKKLKPTYVERFTWGQQDLHRYIFQHYTAIDYHGTAILLRIDSPYVWWHKVASYRKLIFIDEY